MLKHSLLNKIYLLGILLAVLSLHACSQLANNEKIETYDQYRTQKIEPRDSLFILYTVREWGKQEWWTWAIRTDMYKVKTEDITYFIGGTFYSPDRKKMMVWVGKKIPNVATTTLYDKKDTNINKLCPNGADTIYTLSALIGIRDSIDQIWKLYPFDNEVADCFDAKDKVINILGQYYFEKMKTHAMYRMVQSGEKKGQLESTTYDYNLQDKGFWDKCWLWEKDTVGANNLYPFQLKGYDYKGIKCDTKCADPYDPPVINYPQEILKLYK